MAVQAAGQRRRRTRPTARRDLALAHLTLADLRGYRQELQAEETRISYWRRIVQARIDVLRADPQTDPQTDPRADPHGRMVPHLRQVLTDAPIRSRRRALIDAVPVEDIPPLPDLGQLWAREVDPADDHAVHQLLDRLTEAEQDLSSYRHALHGRLNAATLELVARYHENPLLALCALPMSLPDAGRPAAAPATAGRPA